MIIGVSGMESRAAMPVRASCTSFSFGNVGGHDNGNSAIGAAALLMDRFNTDAMVCQNARHPGQTHRVDPGLPAEYSTRS